MCLADLHRVDFPAFVPFRFFFLLEICTAWFRQVFVQSTKLHLIIRKWSWHSVTRLIYSHLLFIPFLSFFFKWFNIFGFAIPSATLNTRTACTPFIHLVRLSPLIRVECKFYLYTLRSFIELMFLSKSRQYDYIIRSPALLLFRVRYTQFTFRI